MDGRIAVNFAGRRLKNPRLGAFGQAEHVDRAVNAGLGGLDRVELVVHRRRRTGQIVDLVGFDIEREGYVMAHQLEGRMAEQAADVVAPAGEKVIHTQDFVAGRNQAFAQVRPDEPGAAGNDDSCHDMLSQIPTGSAQRVAVKSRGANRRLILIVNLFQMVTMVMSHIAAIGGRLVFRRGRTTQAG